jgi:hypothetical protein
MAGITVEQAQAQLSAYLEAERTVLAGQSYEIAGRRMTRADLKAIQEGIKYWNERVAALSARGERRPRARTVIAKD